MQLRHWKTQWIPLQIYVLIVGLKVKELLFYSEGVAEACYR